MITKRTRAAVLIGACRYVSGMAFAGGVAAERKVEAGSVVGDAAQVVW